ncbi:hypothetical protein MMC17_002884 [Xylographa soralifera]|nr:hypothetical protein [Xylographa soralifera]
MTDYMDDAAPDVYMEDPYKTPQDNTVSLKPTGCVIQDATTGSVHGVTVEAAEGEYFQPKVSFTINYDWKFTVDIELTIRDKKLYGQKLPRKPSSLAVLRLTRLSDVTTVFRTNSEARIQFRSSDLILQELAAIQEDFTNLHHSLHAWYPTHPNKHFIQYGAYITKDGCPLVQLIAFDAFGRFTKFLTILGFGTIKNFELNLGMVEIPGSVGTCLFELLKIPDYVKLRLENGDWLKVNFDQTMNPETESWSAMVIELLPFVLLIETNILLMHPFNRETQTHGDLVHNAIWFNITSVTEPVAALGRQTPTKVIATLKHFDKQLKAQIHGLRHIAMDRNKKCGY